MKRRVRTQPSNPFYSNEPAVATGMIADKAPVPSTLASKPPKGVDKHPGRMSGVASFASKSKLPKGKSHPNPPKFGTKAKSPAFAGKVRNSGAAHKFGGVRKLKGI